MQPRTTRRALLLGSLSLVTVLAGCSQPNDARIRLRYWANSLGMRSWGRVSAEDYAGSNNFSDTTPTLTLLLESPPRDVDERAKQALQAQGFTFRGGEWSSEGEKEYRVVELRALPKGATYYLPGAKRTLTLLKPAVRVSLQVSATA